MRVPHYLTRGRNGYFFRITVPASLRPVLRRVTFSHALGHRLADAATIARGLASRYAWAFQAIEVAAVGGDDDALKAGLTALYGGPAETFKIKHGPHGPELETDGTAADATAGAAVYGRVLETWERVEKAKAEAQAQFASPAYQRAMVSINATVPDATTAGKPLGDAVAQWSALESARLKDKPKSWLPKRRALTEFVEAIGPGTTVATITGGMCSDYAAGLARRHKGSTGPTKMGYIGEFFDWAGGPVGYYPATAKNPARGLLTYGTKERAAAAERGAQPFPRSEITKIFDPVHFGNPELLDTLDRWQILLMAYTGARSDDIARLRLDDVHHDPIADVGWWFQVRGGKTRATARKVPIHAELVAMGFPAWVEGRRAEGAAHLFPGLNFEAMNGPQQRVQKAFGRLLVSAGVVIREGTTGGVHCWRDTAIEAMEEAGVAQSWRERYVGHEESGRPGTLAVPHAINYGNDDNLTKTQATLRALRTHCHPPLSWVDLGMIDGKAMANLMADTAAPAITHRPPRAPKDPEHVQRAKERAAYREARAKSGFGVEKK